MEIKITINIDDNDLLKLLGKEEKQKVKTDKKSNNAFSKYARIFNEGCVSWTTDANMNLEFLKNQQCYANSVLMNRGYLFLNDVYDMIGIPRTKDGQVVGWIYNKDSIFGDNFVDFGLDNLDNENVRNFINGDDCNVILDFNVDGNILDRI